MNAFPCFFTFYIEQKLLRQTLQMLLIYSPAFQACIICLQEKGLSYSCQLTMLVYRVLVKSST